MSDGEVIVSDPHLIIFTARVLLRANLGSRQSGFGYNICRAGLFRLVGGQRRWVTLANPSLQTVLGAWQSQAQREPADRPEHLGPANQENHINLPKQKKQCMFLSVSLAKKSQLKGRKPKEVEVDQCRKLRVMLKVSSHFPLVFNYKMNYLILTKL